MVERPAARPPPRMRGRPTRFRNIFHWCRTTPAYAGKTCWVIPAGRRKRDHPRVCGEDFRSSLLRSTARGPPPRMRGRLRGPGPGRRRWWDHPRVCGEDAGSSICVFSLRGPPPRMRGRQKWNVHQGLAVGTTPAYAGKTAPPSLCAHERRDHPRVCGEDSIAVRNLCSG